MKEILERIEKARFLTTDELFENKEKIRKEVQDFDLDTLEIYKWYFFYQLGLLKNPLKEKLWEYLCLEMVTPKREEDLCILYQEYKEKCRNILQYQKKKDEEKGIKIEEINKKQTIKITCVEDLFKFD